MGDGRGEAVDLRFMPHGIAYVAAWQKLSGQVCPLIPDYMPDESSLMSVVSRCFDDVNLSLIFSREMQQFVPGELGTVWVPYAEMIGCANSIGIISLACEKPTGYRVEAPEEFFTRQFARNPVTEGLRAPYELLVGKLMREIRQQKRTLVAQN